mmetsp:Transcript_2960/g.12761  ORF Transcript_2960/g.12761 Transcript_2960/m.12761 type:complete len:205 (+) Transcript_2960:1980-2594(+)
MSPAHRRWPPPKGTYAKSVLCSLGYSPVTSSGERPFHPSILGFLNSRLNRPGSKTSGRSHRSGDRCRFHTATKQSVPFFSVISRPIPPAGSVTSSSARRIRMGGAGYILMPSAKHNRVRSSLRISSTVGTPFGSATMASTSALAAAASSGCVARRYIVHVSTAAVVSCPAMSIVIRSSRSCVDETSSPLTSTRKRNNDASSTAA